MVNSVQCPNCQQAFSYIASIAGKVVRCRNCGHPFPIRAQVPAPSKNGWFYNRESFAGDEQVGPVHDDVFVEMLQTGKIKKRGLVFHQIHTGGHWMETQNCSYCKAACAQAKTQRRYKKEVARHERSERKAAAKQQKQAAEQVANAATEEPNAAGVQIGQVTERSFLRSGQVEVTSTRFVVGSTTYPINQISSVSFTEIPPNLIGAYLAIAIGVVFCVIGGMAIGEKQLSAIGWFSLSAGLISFVTAIVVMVIARRSYCVVITTSAGRDDVLYSDDRDHIGSIVGAINQAIIERG